MAYSFLIQKFFYASAANVIANYLDLDHVTSVHGAFASVQVLVEDRLHAQLEVKTLVGPFWLTHRSHYEYRPPFQVFQIMRSWFASVTALSCIHESDEGGRVFSEIKTQVQLELLWGFRFLSPLVAQRILKMDQILTEEDRVLLERRDRILGTTVQDYLHPQQPLLFKEEFRRQFGVSRNANG